MAISNDPNERLTYCVSKGLVKTVKSLINDINQIQKIQPKTIDMAIESALMTATSKEAEPGERINKQWEIITLLCNIPKGLPQPNAKLVKKALAEHEKYYQHLCDTEFTKLIKEKREQMKKEDWDSVFDYLESDRVKKPSQIAISFTLRVAAYHNDWPVFMKLLNHHEPDWKMAGNLLFSAVQVGQYDAVKQLCNLSQENMPNTSNIKRAMKEAKRTGHHEIASYLACELIHQNNLEKDPLALTQAILQDYVDHSFIGSSLFNSQLKGVKNILTHVKRITAQEHDENARTNAVLDVVQSLQHVLGDNKELMGRVDFIKAHRGKIEEAPSLKVEL
ncbi:ankyrin repeat domain-containing protein [Legionella cherrii]|uniref:Ankyrin repeats (3 copies) n=1 Tax=Legionella cherrii TaxID=28084 RepID=A0ABY6T1R1_9GAMM|nr:ankyrin repeat domain-containing protein [Legionella cherrii]VEB33063.1 Ankyrin repeats (3 copies) [Legionella cherrii]